MCSQRANDPLADAVLGYKKAAKNAAQLNTIIGHAEVDGRVRPQINSLRAITARMSIVEPALQTIPPDMRAMFVADEGQTWVSADYAQVELRVAAALSQEPAWIEAFAAGEDVHQSVADRVGVTRKTAKALNFGVLYGGGKAALARAADIDQVEAGAAIAAFRREHPRFTKWARALSESIVHSPDGIMMTRTGRPIPVDAAFAWRSTNYQIQSTARDLLAGALIEAEKAGLADAIRLPLHDEFLASVDEADADDYLVALTEAMGGVLDGVDIQVEGTRIGKRWGDHHRPEVPDG